MIKSCQKKKTNHQKLTCQIIPKQSKVAHITVIAGEMVIDDKVNTEMVGVKKISSNTEEAV